MLSSVLRGKKRNHHNEHSPFSTPGTQRTVPFTTPRSLQGTRKPTDADFDFPIDDDQVSNGEDHDEDDDEDEDGPEQDGLTPLLPIFEAAQLGPSRTYLVTSMLILPTRRCPSCLQSYPHHPVACHTEMRDHVDLGPTKVATSIAVPRQADTTADLSLTFLQGHAVRLSGQLLTVYQRGADKSREQRDEQDEGFNLRAFGHEVAERV